MNSKTNYKKCFFSIMSVLSSSELIFMLIMFSLISTIPDALVGFLRYNIDIYHSPKAHLESNKLFPNILISNMFHYNDYINEWLMELNQLMEQLRVSEPKVFILPKFSSTILIVLLDDFTPAEISAKYI